MSGENKTALFIGRWSPFHNGHKYIIDSYVSNGRPVLIAIRATNYDVYTPAQRRAMIEAVYRDNPLVDVVIIPDIGSVVVGRGVGYEIARTPEEIEEISATKIRAGELDELPPEVKELIDWWKQPVKDRLYDGDPAGVRERTGQ